MDTNPTTECIIKGRSCSTIIIQRFGPDDYSAWYTDDPGDETSGCSTRGSLEDILRELSDELRPAPVSNTERLEMIGSFIDIFEDFLEERGITLPNNERDQDENAAVIYGTDYGMLEQQVESLLINLNVLD